MNFKDVAVGVDIEDIVRFEQYSTNKESSFLKKVYTQGEIDYCFSYKSPAKHFAVRFCAKEATVKALSFFGIKDVHYKEIEVYRDENSAACIKLTNNKYKDLIFRVSLSHCQDKAVASVILFK